MSPIFNTLHCSSKRDYLVQVITCCIAAETVSYIGLVMDKENIELHGSILCFFISPDIYFGML